MTSLDFVQKYKIRIVHFIGYFNKLKVISVETLMNALKYLSNYCKKMHAGLTFQHSSSIPTEVFKQQP